jgi:hypothetical protein
VGVGVLHMLVDNPHIMIFWIVLVHEGREIIAISALENGTFYIVFIENFHKF